jgi:hypothetical protein
MCLRARLVLVAAVVVAIERDDLRDALVPEEAPVALRSGSAPGQWRGGRQRLGPRTNARHAPQHPRRSAQAQPVLGFASAAAPGSTAAAHALPGARAVHALRARTCAAVLLSNACSPRSSEKMALPTERGAPVTLYTTTWNRSFTDSLLRWLALRCSLPSNAG